VAKKVAEMSTKAFFWWLAAWLAVQMAISATLWAEVRSKVDLDQFNKLASRVEARSDQTVLDLKLLAATDAKLSTAVAVLTTNQNTLGALLRAVRADQSATRQELRSAIDRLERTIGNLVQRLQK
jgi:uncharacterized membrane protein YciS (DUF1049 family)